MTIAAKLVRLICRMPVILREEDYDLWLDNDQISQDRRVELLRPYPAEEMDSYPVSTLINDPQRQGTELIDRAKEA
jgi:putative SOS response-associated peptidase YedK